MRVSFLNEVALDAGGGTETHIVELWRGLEVLGHQVRLFAADWKRGIAWGDIVHIHNMTRFNYGLPALEDAARLRKPALVSLHDYWPFCQPRIAMHEGQNCLFGGCRRQCGRPLPECFEVIARWPCVSFAPRPAAVFESLGIRSQVIPHGIDRQFWHAAPRRSVEGALRVALCTACGAAPWKGVQVAYDVERRLGSAAEFRYLLGGQKQEGVRELLWWADVVLVPSLYEETFCLVAAEAQACGRPVVAFDVGGLIELASKTLPWGDAQGLAAALLTATTLPLRSVRDRLDMARDYVALYERLRRERRAALRATLWRGSGAAPSVRQQLTRVRRSW